MPLAIANRYALALGTVVAQPGSAVSPEHTLEQLEAFDRVLVSSQELRNVLTSPAVAPGKKRAVVAGLGERIGLSESVRNFLFVVIDHRRLAILDEMIEAYRSWLDERLGVARIEVSSARTIDEEQRGALVATFTRLTGRQVRGRFHVDQNLLGGAVVRYGSLLYDGSLRAQLGAMDRAIAGER